MERPDLREALRFLANWVCRHPNVRQISLARLATADKSLSGGELSRALRLLVDRGHLREVYCVQGVDGTLLSAEYGSLDQIPARVPDRLHEEYIATADTDVVPVYVLQGSADGEL